MRFIRITMILTLLMGLSFTMHTKAQMGLGTSGSSTETTTSGDPLEEEADPTDPPDDPDPLDTPIDGGLSLLIAAGVGVGVKKVRDARKKK